VHRYALPVGLLLAASSCTVNADDPAEDEFRVEASTAPSDEELAVAPIDLPDGATYSVRLRELELRIEDLKDQVWCSRRPHLVPQDVGAAPSVVAIAADDDPAP
jgi:hypothetical protein